MDEKLKQRLVGAAVVVSLGVIFLPMILDGGRHTAYEKVDLSIPPAPDIDYESSIEPVTPRQVTDIDKQLSKPVERQGGLNGVKLDQTIPDPKTDVADLLSPIEPAEKVVAKQGKDVTGEDPESPAKPVVKTVPKPKPEISSPDAKKPAEKTATPGAESSAATSVSAWVIQVGSFSSRDNAIELRDRLRKNGFVSFVESFTSAGKTAHRVRIGPETGRDRAEISLNKLKTQLRIDGIIVSYP